MKILSMKMFLSLVVLISFSLSAIAQNEVELLEERTDDGITLTAINHLSDQAVEIVLKINSVGFGLKKEETFTEIVPADGRVLMVTLVPTPNRKCTYSANLSYTTKGKTATKQKTVATKSTQTKTSKEVEVDKSVRQKAVSNNTEVDKSNPLAGKKGIVVYSKNGCGRCDFVTKYLTENNIPFEDLNISTDKTADKQMADVLFANGFKGGSFTTPVITVDDKMYYNIKDLKSFLDELK